MEQVTEILTPLFHIERNRVPLFLQTVALSKAVVMEIEIEEKSHLKPRGYGKDAPGKLNCL